MTLRHDGASPTPTERPRSNSPRRSSMRRKLLLSAGVVVLLLISACSQSGPTAAANPGGPQAEPTTKPGPVALGALPGPLPEPLPLPQLPVSNYLDVNKQEKYEAALQDAFNLLEDRKYPETLAALEA